MGNKVPINFTSWPEVPQEIKTALWDEVKQNSTLPDTDQAQKVVFQMISSSWRDHKSRLKKEYFEPHADSEEIPPCGDDRVDTEQWKTICQYWKLDNVKKAADQNSKNRGSQLWPHLTGRHPFSIIRSEMSSQGKGTSQYDVFVETRKRKEGSVDEETEEVLAQLKRDLEALPEAERTEAAKDRIFARTMGQDKRGRMRCMGKGQSKTRLRETAALNVAAQVLEIRAEMEEMMRRDREQLIQQFQQREEQLRADFQRQIDELRALAHPSGNNFVISPLPPSSASNTSPGVGSTSMRPIENENKDGGDATAPADPN